jgi:hypothetical protein
MKIVETTQLLVLKLLSVNVKELELREKVKGSES